MALVSALLAWIGNRLSSLLHGALGWSVSAMFGRLPPARQNALTVALLVSLLWPVMVVGVFVPAASAWAFPFVPLHEPAGGWLVRSLSLALAIAMPQMVGAITVWIAPPSGEEKPSALRTMAAGFPLTLGYFLACFVTAVTVPLAKAASAMRGWADEHVFVQPRVGEYDLALGELAAACDAAGSPACVDLAPPRMLVASKVLRWFARSIVSPIAAEEPRMLRAEGLELYLYPADLLLRGRRERVARVRATMTWTWLEQHAFIVSDPGAQALQDEMQRMWHANRRHKSPGESDPTAVTRLREIAQELDRTIVPFEQWTTLDRSLHRLQRALAPGAILHDHPAVRRAERSELQEQRIQERESAMANEPMPRVEGRPLEAEPTADLMREALDETRELVRLEVALAREELRGELTRAKAGAIALGTAGGLGVSAFTMFMVTIAVASSLSWLAAFLIGIVLLVTAGAIGYGGLKAMPRKPLGETRERLEADLKQLKERIA